MSIEDIPESDKIDGAPHPRYTETLFGQQEAEQAFLEAFNAGRLHHAWLLAGPRGIGKATLAWKIAGFLLSRPADETAGASAGADMFGDTPALPTDLSVDPDAPTARRLLSLAEPRFALCRRPWDDKAERLKTKITIDEIRKLKSFFNLSAADGGRRVVIVDCADEMNVAAANALLKILEEPPEKSTILLISHRPFGLLPTIRSRCRVLGLRNLEQGDLSAALQQAGVEPDDDSALLNEIAKGSVGEAIRLSGQEGPAVYRELLNLLSQAPGMQRPALIALAESCTGKAADARYDMILGLADHILHRLAIAGTGAALSDDASGVAETQLFSRLSPNAHTARIWAQMAAEMTGRINHARAVNLDPAAVILDMFLTLDQTAGKTAAR